MEKLLELLLDEAFSKFLHKALIWRILLSVADKYSQKHFQFSENVFSLIITDRPHDCLGWFVGNGPSNQLIELKELLLEACNFFMQVLVQAGLGSCFRLSPSNARTFFCPFCPSTLTFGMINGSVIKLAMGNVQRDPFVFLLVFIFW